MIVDTSFVLDVIDNVEAVLRKEEELEAEGVPLVVSAMTVLELYIGVGKVVDTPKERRQVEAVLDSYPLVDMTPSISRRTGRLLGERVAAGDEGEGSGIGKGDAAVAVTALERDEPFSLVTGSLERFLASGVNCPAHGGAGLVSGLGL